jgi:hypothetical protein
MLCDPDIDTVTIEDRTGGYFDDVVVRRHQGASAYIQVKSSNRGDTIVDEKWLTTATAAKGRSPLQRAYDTYTNLIATGTRFSLEVWTNRGFDDRHALLGKLLDQKTDTIDTAQMLAAGPTTPIGLDRTAWATHLAINDEELGRFLTYVRWKQTGSELDRRRECKPLMTLAGLRSDDEAITVGVQLVSGWVTNGSGPRSADDVRAEVAANNLLSLGGELLLHVNGIDRDPSPTAPNVTLDFVDLYEGNDSFARKLLLDAADWEAVVRPSLDDAARRLSSYRVRNVHVAGAMRHPMWFAVGRVLPQVKKWVLSMDQAGATWATNDPIEDAPVRVLASVDLQQGSDVALAIGLTGDPTAVVDRFLRRTQTPVGQLLVLGPQANPSPTSVPSGGWAMAWTRAARDLTRKEIEAAGAKHAHLFLLCPAGVALMLGHQWNVMPPTTIYEYAAGHYNPAAHFDGA